MPTAKKLHRQGGHGLIVLAIEILRTCKTVTLDIYTATELLL